MGYTFRYPGPWGPGKGSDLTGTEVDANFWQAQQDIAAKAAQGVGIANFQVIGNLMYVVLTDHTLLGPYTLPVATLNFRGAWHPNTSYLANDVVSYNGACYAVLINHTSAATFDPGANDGAGHNFYQLILDQPSIELPTGGPAGWFLKKATSADFALTWGLPALAQLTDVGLGSPLAVGQVLAYSHGGWTNVDAPAGSSSGSLAGLSDVKSSPPPADGQSVIWSAADNSFIYGSPPFPAMQDITDVVVSESDMDVVRYIASRNDYEFGLLIPYNQASPSFTVDASLTSQYYNVEFSVAPVTVNIPTYASMPVGEKCQIGAFLDFAQMGESHDVNSLTFTPAGGVTLNVAGGRKAKLRNTGSTARLVMDGINSWYLYGDLALDLTQTTLPASGGHTIDFSQFDSDVWPITPTASETIACASAPPAGSRCAIIVTTSGTTSYTLTFGSNFKSQGTLATGVVSGKVFVVEFISDGTNMNEISRTSAM